MREIQAWVKAPDILKAITKPFTKLVVEVRAELREIQTWVKAPDMLNVITNKLVV